MLGPSLLGSVGPDGSGSGVTILRLKDQLEAIVGTGSSGLTGLWGGGGLILNESGDDTGWVATVGNNPVPAGTGAFQRISVAGRLAMHTSTTGTNKTMSVSVASGSTKTIFALVQMPALPFTNYQTCWTPRGGNSIPSMVGNNGTSTINTGGGSTFYVDGSVTDAVTSGIHVLAATNATVTDTTLHIGGGPEYTDRTWLGAIVVIGTVGSALSAGNITSITGKLMDFVGL